MIPNDRHPATVGMAFLALALGLAVLIGCAVPEKRVVQQVPAFHHPRFSDDMGYDGLLHSIQKSLDYLGMKPPDKSYAFGEDTYSAAHLIRSLEKFRDFIQTRPSDHALREFIRSNYRVYRSVGNDASRDVLFTGYYEPFLEGSLQKSDIYRFPVFGLPEDLIKIDLSVFSDKYAGETLTARLADGMIVPYYDRREIEAEGVLNDTAPVLAWLKDSVELFFLQIQGSGRIYLDNGRVINVHYAASNGRPYRSIGKLLIDEGKIPRSEMSMQRIKQYLEAHPEEKEEILFYNPSYVFFKIEEDGPLGYLDVKLTPGRSIALDRRLFPLPSLAFIETEKPLVDGSGRIIGWEKFRRFVVSQDTGGAIRGPGRSDLFWGNGKYAEIAAGHMQHTGQLYLLVLKPESSADIRP
jgi:membrane-bound lytic murein transglycosylase A